MKVFFGILFCIVVGAPGSSYASNKLTIKCDADNVSCPALPLPPELPSPPPPPPPPVSPVPPALPVLPAVPEIVVPAQAHLACVGKAIGTEITWEYENHSNMTGVCGERNGKPYLKLTHIHIVN